MLSRRQEKIARVICESVSDTIANRLSDPRITGLVTVTKVEPSPNLKDADVYLSIMAANEGDKKKTFTAIEHAVRHIQQRLGHKMTSKFCPKLHFHEDKKFKHMMETFRIIDEVSRDIEDKGVSMDDDVQAE